MKITVILTCFNRKDKTMDCVKRLIEGNNKIDFDFVVVDDGSTDGTEKALTESAYANSVKIIKTAGNCYYSGGMHLGMQYVLQSGRKADYLLMVNDDVLFYNEAIEKLIKQSQQKNDSVVVGVTCDEQGTQTYGAVKYLGGFSVRYRAVKLGEVIECDTFNANCVLIPYNYFEKTGAMDDHYIHSLGDFDYGLSLKRNGAQLYSSEHYVGICKRNSTKGTWLDKSLPLKKRMELKETVKGAPAKQWFYFLKKNFGMGKALVFTVTPYINLILGR